MPDRETTILGRFFDKHGNLRDWTGKMLEAYDNSAECFVEQFDAYPITYQDSGNYTDDIQVREFIYNSFLTLIELFHLIFMQ